MDPRDALTDIVEVVTIRIIVDHTYQERPDAGRAKILREEVTPAREIWSRPCIVTDSDFFEVVIEQVDAMEAT